MLNVLDLFSGAGGLSYGFYSNKNFEIVTSIDFNQRFAETYEKNFSDVNHIVRDILSFSDEEILALGSKNKIDVIIGGPPCQGFSMAGNIGRLEESDKRNDLFLGYLRFVQILRPKLFVMENVANLSRHNKGNTLKQIVSVFQEIGYKVDYKILNASDYSVPQDRRRIFIVGTLEKYDFIFPQICNEKITIEDAISDLPPLKNGEISLIPNHFSMKHSNQMLQKMSYVKEGGDRNDIPIEIRPKSGDIRKYIRLDRTTQSYCITGDMRKVFHYSQNRAFSPRELARLQSFPDSFIFYGTSIDIQQQIGNAVPPRLSSHIADAVVRCLCE